MGCWIAGAGRAGLERGCNTTGAGTAPGDVVWVVSARDHRASAGKVRDGAGADGEDDPEHGLRGVHADGGYSRGARRVQGGQVLRVPEPAEHRAQGGEGARGTDGGWGSGGPACRASEKWAGGEQVRVCGGDGVPRGLCEWRGAVEGGDGCRTRLGRRDAEREVGGQGVDADGGGDILADIPGDAAMFGTCGAGDTGAGDGRTADIVRGGGERGGRACSEMVTKYM